MTTLNILLVVLATIFLLSLLIFTFCLMKVASWCDKQDEEWKERGEII